MNDISPNDPLTSETPVYQALAQMAFWEIKTEDERAFARLHSRDAEGLREDFKILLKKLVSEKPAVREIEINTPGQDYTIGELATRLAPSQIDRLTSSLEAMTRIVHEKTVGQGFGGWFYNWMQSHALANSTAHWGWALKIMKNRKLIWKDEKIK